MSERAVDRDSLPHFVACRSQLLWEYWHTFWMRRVARWWRVDMGEFCTFKGCTTFRRHPASRISIGASCRFNSSRTSNLFGLSHQCIVATLSKGAAIEIGSGCGFSGSVIASAQRITLGSGVRCGANSVITDTDWHSDDARAGRDAPVVIGDNVWLGANVLVLKGVTIGDGTFVGAGAIVTRSLPPGVVAAGNPARIIRKLNPGMAGEG